MSQPTKALSDHERLRLLAKGCLSVLDAERERTGVDEWDEADERCFLYNAASAVIERDDNERYGPPGSGDRVMDECLEGWSDER